MENVFSLLKHILTLDASTPTNISTKSEPEIEKKGTFASPAIALANKFYLSPEDQLKERPLESFRLSD